MKFKKKINLNYYLEEIVLYNLVMKENSLKGKERAKSSIFSKGKSIIYLKTSKSEDSSFQLVKAYRALSFFHNKEGGKVKLVSSRRGLWRIEIDLVKDESENWIVYYLDFFNGYVKKKGLKVRNFGVTDGWLFLFREIGELRFSGLPFDYYSWNSTWSLLLKKSRFLGENVLLFSSLKLKYKLNALSSRKRL
jgi:hypothetical protein